MLKNEPLLGLVEAVKLATGRRVHLSTPLRWASRGSRGVRLETVVMGGRRYTSVAACERFVAAVTEAAGGIAAPHTTIKQFNKRAEKSSMELAARLA